MSFISNRYEFQKVPGVSGLVNPENLRDIGGPVNSENQSEVGGPVYFSVENVQEGIRVGGEEIGGPVAFSPESK